MTEYHGIKSGEAIHILANTQAPNHTEELLKDMRKFNYPAFIAESTMSWFGSSVGEVDDPAYRASMTRLYERSVGRALEWEQIEQIRGHGKMWQQASILPCICLESSAELVRPLAKLYEYLDKLPAEWDILYLGWLDLRQRGSKVINSRILQPKEPLGCFAYVLSESGQHKLVGLVKDVHWEGTLDETLANLTARGQLKSYACNRPMAILTHRPQSLLPPIPKEMLLLKKPADRFWWWLGTGIILCLILMSCCGKYLC